MIDLIYNIFHGLNMNIHFGVYPEFHHYTLKERLNLI